MFVRVHAQLYHLILETQHQAVSHQRQWQRSVPASSLTHRPQPELEAVRVQLDRDSGGSKREPSMISGRDIVMTDLSTPSLLSCIWNLSEAAIDKGGCGLGFVSKLHGKIEIVVGTESCGRVDRLSECRSLEHH
jgi:hypothetical protein